MRLVFALLTGLVFGSGIAISGMIDPSKVLNFFDLFGSWDPSLAFVMAGALLVTFIGYRAAWRMPKPILASHFQVPSSTTIDKNLIGGAALFGIGWGIAGFCPGAAIPAIGTGSLEVMSFLLANIAGFAGRRFLIGYSSTKVAA